MLSSRLREHHLIALYGLITAFTAILLAYLLVWFPQPIVGLSFIGIEMGEWVKFLPQVQSGEIAADRNLFYLPPITLSLMIIAWTLSWPNKRWKTWMMRAIAIMIALLAIPAIESFLDETPDQWLFRSLLIILVIGSAIATTVAVDFGGKRRATVGWMAILVLSFVGAALPTWAYVSILPATGDLLAVEVGIGPGVWLNLIGHLLALFISLYYLLSQTKEMS